MDKLTNLWDNTLILFESVKNNPKKAVFIFLAIFLVMFIVFKLVLRVPSAISCTWDAVISQSVPSEKWRYNWMDDQCQYFNNTRWIELKRYTDVGGSVSEDGIEE